MADDFEAILFDLDGTLADTLAPIAAAGNHMLTTLGRQARPVPDYRYLAGQGVAWLVEHALQTSDSALVARGVELFRSHYAEHGDAMTEPYDGIDDMLQRLLEMGFALAVLSNKMHDATERCVAHLFPDVPFDRVLGHRDGHPLKPDPAGALEIAADLGIAPARWLYVGDTRVDMLTARAAGMSALGVTWGFRDLAELRDAGAWAVIDHPSKLPDLA